MRFSLTDQALFFLASIALGAAMAMIYDLIRAVRMLIRCGRVHILVSDILFFFVCGILTSLFALPFNKGGVRAFILFGEAVGFLTYRLTLGSIFGKFYAVIARLLRQFIRKICEKLKKIYDCLLKAGTFLLYNIFDEIVSICRTAISGVRILAVGARSARRPRRRKHRQSPARGKPAACRTDTIKYYPIPLRGDRIK